MSLGGLQEHIYQHSFISIHRHLPKYTHKYTHRETEGHGKTLSLPNGILHYEAGQTAQFSSSVPQKVPRELKPSQVKLNGE